ncbi:hypothetical protein LCM23_12885 [Cytobacillus kochii]|uniref:hypothetical protein n=1 Tax=Cytobacillus kochii TaxID=859143 RepID=UPI001CD421AD|nr:hypothetical protein [Cytobacillus kochii]MCA1026989.1 hypothetical protein [Cytobacillus kochii]
MGGEIWKTKAIQAILSQNKSDVEKAEEIVSMFDSMEQDSNKLKAKFNVEQILNGDATYPESFVELVKRYENQIIEVEEEIFGAYELVLEGKTYGLGGNELILIK